MANYLPKIDTPLVITRTASAKVTGGRLVEVSGSKTVAHAAAGSAKVVGVAMHDAEQGSAVAVSLGGVQRPLASAAVTAGAGVAATADGKIAAGTDNSIGIALESADAGAQVEVLMAR